jgi:tetratricopeptide (TPR) repeat protein
MIRDLAASQGYNHNDESGDAMKFEARKEFKFSQPEAVQDVELTLSHDDLDSQAAPIDLCRAAESPSFASPNSSPESESFQQANFQDRCSIDGCSSVDATRHYNSSPSAASRVWRLGKQHFNVIYFALSACAVNIVCQTWKLPILWLAVAFCAAAALASAAFILNNRAHPSDFSFTFSTRTRRLIRTSALLFPLPFFAIVIAQFPAQWQLQEGQKLFHDGKYKEALVHLNIAAVLNPVSEKAFAELADCYNFVWKSDKSLANADKALSLDPLDGDAWASKAWALNAENQYAQALPAALNAVKYRPGSGQANHALAAAYLNLGDYELALPPASRHIRIHFNEPGAFELRADILDKLGQSEEAALDRKQAQALAGSGGK